MRYVKEENNPGWPMNDNGLYIQAYILPATPILLPRLSLTHDLEVRDFRFMSFMHTDN